MSVGPSPQVSIAIAAEVARRLEQRLGLSVGAAAIVAVIDAMEAAQWPAAPIEELIVRVPRVDRATLERDLVALRAMGMVIDAPGGLLLDTTARRALAGLPLNVPADARAWRGRGTQRGALADVLADPSGAVVISGDTPARRFDAVIEAASGPLLSLPEPSDLVLREAWLRGMLVALDEPPSDALERAAQSRARIAVLVGRERAGEALARIRRRRDAIGWRVELRPAAAPPVKPPKALAALVRSATPRSGGSNRRPSARVAHVRGTPARVRAAAEAVAARNRTQLRVADVGGAGGLARAREALGRGKSVVLVEHASALAPLAAEALAVLIDQVIGVVVFTGDAELPAPLAAVTTLDVALAGTR